MLYFSLAIGCLAVWYATRISVQQADQFIYGDSSSTFTDDVRPGSGKFFDRIASTYDILNTIISLGFHASWRRTMLDHIQSTASAVLDVSTGTADVAIALARRNATLRVVALDPSERMLQRARTKLDKSTPPLKNVRVVKGAAESLPFPDADFDAVTVSFGVRNFENRLDGLREIARVLSPHGRLLVLELSQSAKRGLLGGVVSFFCNAVVPALGGFISGDSRAYRYLAKSMADFPDKEEFSDMLQQAGFHVSQYQRLPPMGAGPELYVATKIASQTN